MWGSSTLSSSPDWQTMKIYERDPNYTTSIVNSAGLCLTSAPLHQAVTFQSCFLDVNQRWAIA